MQPRRRLTTALSAGLCVWSVVLVYAADATADEQSNREAGKLALSAHAQAAAIDKLPRFYLRARGRTETDYLVKTSTDDPLENLIAALDPDVPQSNWHEYTQVFAWDEGHFIIGNPSTERSAPDQPGSPVAEGDPGFRTVKWGTHDISGQRGQGGKEPAHHVVRASAAEMWEAVHLSTPNYLIATWHEFWWGDNNANHNQHFANAAVPPARVTYRHLGTAEFDGDTCNVVESRGRFERLWISQKTGLIRGYVHMNASARPTDLHNSARVQEIAGRSFATPREYIEWYRAASDQLSDEDKWALHIAWSQAIDWDRARPALVVRFRDFREIAPGVWWPFREDRAQGKVTEKGFDGMVSNFTVHAVRTDFDLSETVDAMLPKDGERVQDQRYAVPVDYEYHADRTGAEILEMVDALLQERQKDAEILGRLKQAFEQMVSRRAPALPEAGWVGGSRPDVAGKPYLIHIWATWCGPCKRDFDTLKRLATGGSLIVGLHPSGTSAADVEEAMEGSGLGHPTFVQSEDHSPAGRHTIGGYPATIFPYYILVDADGNVATHGSLRENDYEILHRLRELREKQD